MVWKYLSKNLENCKCLSQTVHFPNENHKGGIDHPEVSTQQSSRSPSRVPLYPMPMVGMEGLNVALKLPEIDHVGEGR